MLYLHFSSLCSFRFSSNKMFSKIILEYLLKIVNVYIIFLLVVVNDIYLQLYVLICISDTQNYSKRRPHMCTKIVYICTYLFHLSI